MRQALDYYTRLARLFPPDAPAWDNTSKRCDCHLSNTAGMIGKFVEDRGTAIS